MTAPLQGSNQDPYSAPKANVWVPEEPAAAGPVKASRLTRLGAHLLDMAFWILACLPFYLTAIVGTISASTDEPAERMGLVWVGVGLSALLALPFCVLQLVLLARAGQTLGKKLTRIKIVRSDGSRASFGRILGLRIVLTAVLGIIPLFSLIDVCMIFGAEQRCVHDLIADTIVVRA